MQHSAAIKYFLLGIIFISLQTNHNARPSFPEPALQDDTGFEPIFNGETLEGWDGDPVYWRVDDGCIVGEITPETIVERNTFLIWRKGVTGDFELKVEYRVSAEGNSGIGYRCEEVPGVPWALKGYQSDIDGKGEWNEAHLIVRGNVMIHMVNGHVMSMVIDDDPDHRKMEGLLGVQVHVEPPMMIEYRNFRYKKL